MKKSVRILFIISAVLTTIGAVSIPSAWVTGLLFPVGLSLGIETAMYHSLSQKERDRVPTWLSWLFVLSFVPIIFFLYLSVKAGINGTGGFITPSKHGWAAFWDTFFPLTLVFTVIPIIPAAVIIQVNFIVLKVKLMKKRNAERS